MSDLKQKSQKQAVVDEVISVLGSDYDPSEPCGYKLSKDQLYTVYSNIEKGILSGDIAYGKDVGDTKEVRAYSRSVTMNHIKKAKELNGGGQVNVQYKPRSNSKDDNIVHGIRLNLLTQELQEYVLSKK